MTAEAFLSSKLRKFGPLEYSLVIVVYFVLSLLVASVYAPLTFIGWWFYLILAIFTAFPLVTHLLSQSGNNVKSKMLACIKSNAPAFQVLLFFTTFFIACMLGVLFPVLLYTAWWVYVIIGVVCAIKPLQKTWFW